MSVAEKSQAEEVPVAKIGQEVTTKHMLENTWSFWVYRADNSKDFNDNLKVISTINSVEDFWALTMYLKEADKLHRDWGYYFFKEGIRPMWEDPANKFGGRWLIQNNRRERPTDTVWREILLCMIGEQFGEYNDHINGAFVVIKGKADRVGVWTRQCTDRDAVVSIGKLIKERTKITSKEINYEAHDSKANKHLSYPI